MNKDVDWIEMYCCKNKTAESWNRVQNYFVSTNGVVS